MLQVEYLKR